MIAAADESVSDADLLEMEENACPTCGSCSGMFTANSMNCLAEAIGLALPGNGTILATHKSRKKLFEDAGRQLVEITRRYYEEDDESVLPRSIATSEAFENAMALDVAMGGSTNTILHILAAAREAEVDFGLKEINEISLRVPCLCKVAPATSKYHVEDVHRAGGIPAILGELDRAGLLHRDVPTVNGGTLGDMHRRLGPAVAHGAARGDGAVARRRRATSARSSPTPRTTAGTTSTSTAPTAACATWSTPTPVDGGLAVLYGNIALDGAVVKTAGVDESIWRFTGPAVVFESQDRRRRGHPRATRSRPATWWSSATRGPRADPACRRCSTRPRSSRAGASARRARWSPTAASPAAPPACPSGTPPPRRPRAASIALVEDGDLVEIDIPGRSLELQASPRPSWPPAASACSPTWAATGPATATAR